MSSNQVPVYVPTPEEIAERAAEVRSSWSESKLADRTVTKPTPWIIPSLVRDKRRRNDSDANPTM